MALSLPPSPSDPTDRRDLPRFLPGPRERLARLGAEALDDADLVALVLGTGTIDEPVQRVAARLLAQHGDLRRLARASVGELASARGLGAGKAARLAAAFELARRLTVPGEPPTRIRSSADVDTLLCPRLAHLEVEHFVVLALDARHRVLREIWLAKGTFTACPVSAADVYRAVLREPAPAVLVAHNHPSGEPTPSAEDVALTQRLVQAGDLLGVRFVDHVVVAREGYASLVDLGLVLPGGRAA
ncbi:MAG: DNA repair protein RadC [Sandaracinaceae bacterium]